MNELKTFNISYEAETPAVSARELHEFLEVNSVYTTWFKRMCEYGFTEGLDYTSKIGSVPSNRNDRDYTQVDHFISLDMAKELCMIQRTEKGKIARQHFIEIEKRWNTPELIMSRALKMADKRIKILTEEKESLAIENKAKDQIIGELKPKADYTDRILKSHGTVPVTAIAKDYGMSGMRFNHILNDLGVQYKQGSIWLLYRKYQDKGYTHSKAFDYTDSKGRPQTRMITEWTQKGRLFLYNLLKENDILPLIEAA